MWGVWVATAGGLDFPLAEATTQRELDQRITAILSMFQRAGIDTVFFQARACGDAYYQSKLFPTAYGLPKGYDPLERFIQMAHDRGIELHAWVNPYRVKYPDNLSKRSVDPCYLKLGKASLIEYRDGSVHLNPICDTSLRVMEACVDELITRYNIDGIHMDDRYYPGSDVDDGLQADSHDIRRHCVTKLIKRVRERVDAAKRTVLFGVSPGGIWANKTSHPMGSDTQGVEAYHDHYADAISWMQEGLLDYCIPQLYDRCGDPKGDYKTLLRWWVKRAEGTNTDLVIGHSAYKVNDPLCPMFDLVELERQLQLNHSHPAIRGSAFFRSGSLMANPALTALICSWSVQKHR